MGAQVHWRGGDSRLAGGADTETKFLRRRGTSARISIAVYLRIRGLSASTRCLVPALVFHGSEVSTMMHVGGKFGNGRGRHCTTSRQRSSERARAHSIPYVPNTAPGDVSTCQWLEVLGGVDMLDHFACHGPTAGLYLTGHWMLGTHHINNTRTRIKRRVSLAGSEKGMDTDRQED